MSKWVMLILISFYSIISTGARVPPPSQKITFEEYRELLKDTVKRVPDLQTLWKWVSDEKIKGVYFGGGALRGLLVWLNKNLEFHTPDEIRRMNIPPVSELLIVKDADRDIYAPNEWAQPIKKWQSYSNWDVLDETFYQNTVINAGPTVDKIRVNPIWVDDPLGALELFYKGKIELKWGSRDYENAKESPVFGDSKMGLGLRFLRFTIDLGEVADPTPDSEESLRKISADVLKYLPKNETTEMKWPPSGEFNLWTEFRIRYALKKLAKANKENILKVAQVLKRYNLLETLGQKNYYIPEYNYSNPKGYLSEYKNYDLTIKDLVSIARMVSWTVDVAMSYHQWIAGLATNSEELEMALKPLFDVQSDNYKKELSKFTSEEVGRNRIRISSIAKAREIYEKNICCEVDDHIRFLDAYLGETKSVAEFEYLSRYPINSPSDSFRQSKSQLFKKHSAHYFSLNPTVDQVINFMNRERPIYMSFLSSFTEIAAKSAKATQDYLKILTPIISNPPDEYLISIADIADQTWEHFLTLKPSFEQMREYFTHLNPANRAQKVSTLVKTDVRTESDLTQLLSLDHSQLTLQAAISWRVQHIKTTEDLDKALAPPSGVSQEEWHDVQAKARSEYSQKVIKLSNFDKLKNVFKDSDDFEFSLDLFQEISIYNLSASEFLGYIEVLGEKVKGSQQDREFQKFLIENASAFRELGPNQILIDRYADLISDRTNRSIFLGKNLLKSPNHGVNGNAKVLFCHSVI